MQIMSAHHTPDLEETTSITTPKPTVDIRAYVLYGCWEKQSRTSTVWSYAGRYQAEGLLHRTSIALSLAQGFSQRDLLFPSVQQQQQQQQQLTNQRKINSPRMDISTKTRSRQRIGDHVQGSRRRSVSPSPTRRKQRKRKTGNADQDAAARGVK